MNGLGSVTELTGLSFGEEEDEQAQNGDGNEEPDPDVVVGWKEERRKKKVDQTGRYFSFFFLSPSFSPLLVSAPSLCDGCFLLVGLRTNADSSIWPGGFHHRHVRHILPQVSSHPSFPLDSSQFLLKFSSLHLSKCADSSLTSMCSALRTFVIFKQPLQSYQPPSFCT